MIPLPADLLLAKAVDWVWQASLAGAVLAVLVVVLQLAFGRTMPPRWRYVLWLLVVGRLLMPVVPPSSFSVFNWLGHGSISAVVPIQLPTEGAPRAGETPALRSLDVAATSVSGAVVAKPDAVAAIRRETSVLPWRNIIGWVWLLGATGYWLLVLVQHWRLASALKREKPITDPRFLAMLAEGKATLRLRGNVRAIETARVSVPAVFGFVRPELLLPKGMLDTWETPALRHVILHELVHVRRRDVLLNWVLVLVQGLHWFNPAVWYALRRLRAEREIVCDVVVLSHLGAADRRNYGATLLKLVQTLSRPIQVPSLTSILTRQNEIERRMTMISQFKPSTRRTAFASTALLLVLACFTFTRAADKKQPVPSETAASQAETARKTFADQQDRSIRILEIERAKQRDEIHRKQGELDMLKEKLQITGMDATAGAAMTADNLRELEKERISFTAEYRRMRSSYQQLTNFTKAELRAVLPTATPDPLLNRLLEEFASVEQKIAETGVSQGTNHPELAGLQARREKIHTQIDERVEGILNGLKIRMEGLRIHLETLQAEADQATKRDIEQAIQRQPYYRAQRDLENLQQVAERLDARIWQEKVDSALPRNTLPRNKVE